MKLLLARHGNTFAPDDPVVWTGATNDIPLVEQGRTQALELLEALNSCSLFPSKIYSGPLVRTREYAEIVQCGLNCEKVNLEISSCLHEVDYGRWTGLTTEEVIALGDGKEQEAWSKESAWPYHIFGGDPEKLQDDIHQFVSEIISDSLENDLVLLVTSNGVLRYFLTLVENGLKQAIKQQDFKVKTGNICLLEWKQNKWKKIFWNQPPMILHHLKV